MKIKVLVVDDEPPARKKLIRFLSNDKRVDLVGEAGDGAEAVKLIEEKQPDVLFLDIQMPTMTGFEVLESLDQKCPQVIFTTAYNQYAIKAFEVRALDYLLKPFDKERLNEALQRAIELRDQGSSRADRIEELLVELRSKQPYLRRILLRTAGRIIFVDTKRIQHVEAAEKYVQLHVEGNSYLHRETMNNLEEKLDPKRFTRVHRSAIVNKEFIRELEYLSHGDYEIVLSDGTRVPLGRTYREEFLRRFTEE
jgi:two-component system LytT family response regulator